jgi:hypothetical protein
VPASIDINGEAWRMIGEAVEQAIEEMKKLREHSLHKPAREYCTGITEGISRFQKSGPEVLDWAEDSPDQCIEETCDAFCAGEKDMQAQEATK